MNLSLKKRLVLTFIFTALLPLVCLGFFSYYQTSKAIQAEAEDRLAAVRNIKAEQVTSYFETIKKQMITFSSSTMIVDAMKNFDESFNTFVQENSYTENDFISFNESLEDFYVNEFGKKFNAENKKNINAKKLLNNLPLTARALQYNYIANNNSPLGGKDALVSASDSSTYSKHHKKYHPTIQKFLAEFGYYDIFLVNNKGEIVYSVFKELDYATSLTTGPYKETNFAKAFRKAKSLNGKDDFVLEDYATYIPSYKAPASFIASPIWSGDKKIGVAVFQMPIDRLNAIMLERSGMGKTGESYLVGTNQLMRSDSFLSKNEYNVVEVFKNPEARKIESLALAEAMADKSGFISQSNYLGSDVYSSFKPIDILGLKWALIVETTEAEALKALASIKWAVFLCLIACCLLTFFVGLSLSSSISRKIRSIAQSLKNNSLKVRESSEGVNLSSARLSEAATEQAASIQETFSSIDQIRKMIKLNADAAKNSTVVSEKSTEVVGDGKDIVNNMLGSISLIAESTDEIMQEVESNNKEISNIINVISNIGDKTKVINDIVFQTKLLSFNASVEAARAGEHGKGFAVVAEEVGNLATMSGNAAEEITTMLDSSIKQVTGIVENSKAKIETLVLNSKNRVSDGSNKANECAKALDKILENVIAVDGKIKEIAISSAEQASGVGQVTQAMEQLDKSTSENTDVAQQSSGMAESLLTQSDCLNKAVESLFLLVNGGESEDTSNVYDFPVKEGHSGDDHFEFEDEGAA